MRNLTACARLQLLLPLLAFAASAAEPRPETAPPKRGSMVVESEDAAEEPPPPVPQGDERRAIGDYIRDNSGPIRECYEKRLQESKQQLKELEAAVELIDKAKSTRTLSASETALESEWEQTGPRSSFRR